MPVFFMRKWTKHENTHFCQSRTQSLLASYCACSTKTKGSGKDRFLSDPDWSPEM